MKVVFGPLNEGYIKLRTKSSRKTVKKNQK